MRKKRFIVEIEIPDNTGDLCWDKDETGLQAFHDCVISALTRINLRELCDSLKHDETYQKFIERQIKVRESFKVIESLCEEKS